MTDAPPSIDLQDTPPEEGAPLGRAQRRRRWRLVAWVTGALLALDLLLLLFALSFAHVTSEGTAKRSLRHIAAILTEVDAYLDAQFPDLQEAARTEEAELTLPDFPLDLRFTPQEVRDADRAQFRAILLDRAADVLYQDGAAALREEDTSAPSRLSLQGIVRLGIDFFRARPHSALTTAVLALAAAAGVLAATLVLVTRWPGWLLGWGVAVLAAGLPFLILAIAARFAFRLAADGADDYLVREFLTLAQELTWAPIRNGMVFSVGGGVFIALALLIALGRTLARSRRLAQA